MFKSSLCFEITWWSSSCYVWNVCSCTVVKPWTCTDSWGDKQFTTVKSWALTLPLWTVCHFMAPEYDFRILHFFEFKMFIMFPNLRKLIMNTCCEVLALEIIGLYTNTTAPWVVNRMSFIASAGETSGHFGTTVCLGSYRGKWKYSCRKHGK